MTTTADASVADRPLFDCPECPECHAPRTEIAPGSFVTDHLLTCPWLLRVTPRAMRYR